MSPVSNVFGASSSVSAQAGPADVSGSLQAGFGPPQASGGRMSIGDFIGGPTGKAAAWSTFCVIALLAYYWILP